jgi:DNA mismatch repair protein PMS2
MFSVASLQSTNGVTPEEVAKFGTKGNLDARSFNLDGGSIPEMRVIGQFNLGFIIAALRMKISDCDSDPIMKSAPCSGDVAPRDLQLFIIDQHTADENFRFEGFNSESRIASQALATPHFVTLTPAQEEVAYAHLDVFEANGFELQRDDLQPPGKRLKLSSVPCNDTGTPADRSIVFGESDVHELLSAIKPGTRPEPVGDYANLGSAEYGSPTSFAVTRPRKVRQILACRACRGAVMTGKALRFGEMELIIRNLGTLQQPWDCPHGRPTIRHLVNTDTAWRQPERPPPLATLLTESRCV